ncbi:MAG: efflux RND transporter periplasmic adaptor subunit [Symploca sp. SIO1C2]|nr:efflux RND transporter periplasmic adaptor subunit [Symploca sp. SIO1C2]
MRNVGRLLRGGAVIGLLVFVFLTFTPFGKKNALIFSKITNQSNQNKSTTQETPLLNIIPVETTVAIPVNSYQVERSYTGTIIPRRSSSLSFEIAGKLTQITVDGGDRVEPGTPLAFLDTSTLKIKQQELFAQRKQLVAQLKEMQAGSRAETIAAARASVRQLSQQLQLARQKSARRESLYQEGAISREQQDEAANEASTLQARLDNAQSQLDELIVGTRPERIEAQEALIEQQDANIANLEVELKKSILQAPFAGTVSARLVDEGTVVGAGQSILKLVENNQLEAHIGVPVNAAAKIKVGNTFTLQIEQKNYQAQVGSILPEVDPQTLTVTIVFKLTQGGVAEVVPGQVAKLQLTETINHPGYWLPITALVEGERGLWSCYVLGEKQNVAASDQAVFPVKQQDVEVLYTQSDRVLVRGTLQPNQQVIVDGIHRIIPGQIVSVSNGKTKD